MAFAGQLRILARKHLEEGLAAQAVELLRRAREARKEVEVAELGAALWLTGDAAGACDDWLYEMRRFRRHEPMYNDVGIITIPALLWWATAHKDLPEVAQHRREVVDDLKWRSTLRYMKVSPWALTCAGFLLGRNSEEELFAAINRKSEYTNVHDSLRTYFYIGAKALDQGDVAKYKAMLAKAASFVPHYHYVELNLIRHELDRLS